MIDFRLTETDERILERTRAEGMICRRYAREFDEREEEMIPDTLPEADDFYANAEALPKAGPALVNFFFMSREIGLENVPDYFKEGLVRGRWSLVASFAIQLAKHIGAKVITTASAANHDYLRDLGADEIIDYHAQDFTNVASDCDAVFETVGGEVAQRSFAVLKPGGRAAFIASGTKALEPPRDDVRSFRPAVGRDRPHLERIVDLVRTGSVRVPEITEFALSDAIAAHRISEGRHLRGKLVFKVR